MENKKAIELIDNILLSIHSTGVHIETLIEELKQLRNYALEEQIPLVVKVLRLTYEHLEENQNFLIAIPGDDPLDEGGDSVLIESSPAESLAYMLSLIKDLKNKMNVSDLKEYRNALYAN